MGNIGLYLLMILALLAVVGTIVLTYRWIRKIIRQVKSKHYLQAIITFMLPVAIVSVIAFYIEAIIETVLIIIAAFMVVGVMSCVKHNTIYYYSD